MIHPKKKVVIKFLVLAATLGAGLRAQADQNYSDQVFFENSLSPENYFYSRGKVSAPSTLELSDGKLPVESETFISGPNALKLQWESAPNGGWSAEVKLYEWRNRAGLFPGSTLFLWLYAAQRIRAADLPRLALRDAEGNFTKPLELSANTHDLNAPPLVSLIVDLAHVMEPPIRISSTD